MHTIKIVKKIDGNFNPKVYSLLKIIPEKFLYFHEHCLRHPLGIYNKFINEFNEKSLSSIKQFNKTLKSFKQGEDFEKNLDLLLAIHQDFLFQMNEFFDNCYSIIKCFVPKNKYNKFERFDHQWLKKAEFPNLKKFDQEIKPFKKRFSISVNKIKHEQGRLRKVYIKGNNQIHLGYFIEGVDYNGVVCPHPEVHRDDPAFSFVYDYRFSLFAVYYICKLMTQLILDFLKLEYNFSLVPKYETDEFPLYNLIKEITKLPLWLMLREYKKYVPEIYINEKVLIFDISKKPPKLLPKKGHVRTEFKGDGASKSFRFPGLF